MEIADLAFPLQDEAIEDLFDKPKDHLEYSIPSDLLPHERWSRHSEFALKAVRFSKHHGAKLPSKRPKWSQGGSPQWL